MIVLALDTAGVDCAAAVYDSDRDLVLAEITDSIGKGHAEHLMALIDRVLDKAGFGLEAVERIAVTVGPGSFTGIRVGVAAARGFALALGIPAVGVTTLAVIAAAHRGEAAGRPILVAMDAKRGEIYLQMFGGDGVPLNDAEAVGVEEAQAQAQAAPFDGLLAGSAVPLLRGQTADAAGATPEAAAGNGARADDTGDAPAGKAANVLPIAHGGPAATARQTSGTSPVAGLPVAVLPTANIFPISDVARLGAHMPVGEKPKPLYLRGPDAKPQLGFAVARQ